MSHLEVDLVAPDRKVWSGRASQVSARTSEGYIGILPKHEPLLAVLAESGEVRIHTDGEVRTVVAEGGFLSVDGDQVTIVTERVLDATA